MQTDGTCRPGQGAARTTPRGRRGAQHGRSETSPNSDGGPRAQASGRERPSPLRVAGRNSGAGSASGGRFPSGGGGLLTHDGACPAEGKLGHRMQEGASNRRDAQVLCLGRASAWSPSSRSPIPPPGRPAGAAYLSKGSGLPRRLATTAAQCWDASRYTLSRAACRTYSSRVSCSFERSTLTISGTCGQGATEVRPRAHTHTQSHSSATRAWGPGEGGWL